MIIRLDIELSKNEIENLTNSFNDVNVRKALISNIFDNSSLENGSTNLRGTEIHVVDPSKDVKISVSYYDLDIEKGG